MGNKLGDDMLILNSFPDCYIFKCSALIGSKKCVDFIFSEILLSYWTVFYLMVNNVVIIFGFINPAILLVLMFFVCHFEF